MENLDVTEDMFTPPPPTGFKKYMPRLSIIDCVTDKRGISKWGESDAGKGLQGQVAPTCLTSILTNE